MSVKSFIKTASFKSIIVLLCTLLISGIFLTFANALLHVSPEERNAREIAKIYGEGAVVTEMTVADNQKNLGNAIIEKAYSVDDGNYLIKSVGKGGWGGNIPCWVVVEMTDGKISGVGKVQVVTAESKETFLGKFSDSFYTSFGENYVDGIVYSTDDGFVTSGATLSSNAICNAVNGAITFVKVAVLGEEYVGNPFDSFQHIDYINKDKTVHYVDGNVVTYKVVTTALGEALSFTVIISVDANKTVSAYSIETNGSTAGYDGSMISNIASGIVGKNASQLLDIVGEVTTDGVYDSSKDSNVLSTGATKSNLLCYYAALFATANYDAAKALPSTSDEPITAGPGSNEPEPTIYDDYLYTTYIDKNETSHVYEDGVITYDITTFKTGVVPNPYEITISVDVATGAITEYTIDVSGAFEDGFNNVDYPSVEFGEQFETYLVGKTADDIKAILGDNEDLAFNNSSIRDFEDGSVIFTGATQSNFICLYAALFATANCETALSSAFGYTAYINVEETTYSYENNVATYSITTLKNGVVPNPYEITISVDCTTGAITEYTIDVSGAFEDGFNNVDYPSVEFGEQFETYLVGKTVDDLKEILGDNANLAYNNSSIRDFEDGSVIFTGATQSNFVCLYAALYATANYDLVSIVGGTN